MVWVSPCCALVLMSRVMFSTCMPAYVLPAIHAMLMNRSFFMAVSRLVALLRQSENVGTRAWREVRAAIVGGLSFAAYFISCCAVRKRLEADAVLLIDEHGREHHELPAAGVLDHKPVAAGYCVDELADDDQGVVTRRPRGSDGVERGRNDPDQRLDARQRLVPERSNARLQWIELGEPL